MSFTISYVFYKYFLRMKTCKKHTEEANSPLVYELPQSTIVLDGTSNLQRIRMQIGITLYKNRTDNEIIIGNLSLLRCS